VEWAGHPNWYFLISKFSIPWLSRPPFRDGVGCRRRYFWTISRRRRARELAAAGVALPEGVGAETVYSELLLKPLFSFAGKGIRFDPTQGELEQVPADRRAGFLLQQRMRFEPTIETPHGLTQAEIRILYLWPGRWQPDARLVAGAAGPRKMMGVDHNRNQEWVGASAAFFPK